VLETANADPSTAAPALLVSCTVEDGLVVELEMVRATLAITPFAIVLELIPHSKHMLVPGPFEHEICLPAAVADTPAVTTTDEKSTVEYCSVHCRPAGAVPEPLKPMSRLTIEPGLPEPDVRLSELFWHKITPVGRNARIRTRRK